MLTVLPASTLSPDPDAALDDSLRLMVHVHLPFRLSGLWIKDFANVASAMQALSLLLIPSPGPTSPSTSSSTLSVTSDALDADVYDRSTPLKLGTEGVLAEERKEEAESVLASLGSMSEKSPMREVSVYIYSDTLTQIC